MAGAIHRGVLAETDADAEMRGLLRRHLELFRSLDADPPPPDET